MQEFNLAVFSSHFGSNLQSIIDAKKNGKILSSVKVVISNNQDSYALVRAKQESINNLYISKTNYPDDNTRTQIILNVLNENKIDLILLLGYMKKIPNLIIKKYQNKIINIHPSLLPQYGGSGMYGIHVHKSIILNQEKYSGVSLHLVNEEYDQGHIISQLKIPVNKNDDETSLQTRIQLIEHLLLVSTIQLLEQRIINLGLFDDME